MLAALFGGCDSGPEPFTPEPRFADASQADPTSPPWYPASLTPLQGYFEGYVTIGGVEHWVDGLITADGLARIHINRRTVSRLDLADSAQFIGHVVGDAGRLEGFGSVVGEGCAQAESRFCKETASAEISLTLTPNRTDGLVTGAIRLTTNAGRETWTVEMRYPERRFTMCTVPCYVTEASLADAARMYYLERGEFLNESQFTLMSVDANGRLFFQEPNSGCIGNGTLAPHLDGAMNVFDATLILETCKDELGYLNGEFEGIATIHTTCPEWDCMNLKIYLGAVGQAPPRRSVTLWWRGW